MSAIDLASSDVTGVLPVANGGTASSSGVNLTSAIWNISLWDTAIWPVVFGVLPPAQGGTGLDTSASTGVAQVTAGLWSVSAIDLASADVTGTLPVTSGGTGLATATQGDLLYGSASNTISRLTKDANATRYLSNTGTSNNPAWAQVNVANGVTGDLPYANLTPASAASTLVGRGSASGAGDWQEITVGSGLAMTGTTLSSSGGSGAPTTATYITQTADATLSNEQALSALASGYMKVTTGTGVVTSQATPIPLADGGTAQSTAAAALGASGLNIESATGHGDSDYTILATDRLVYTTAALTAVRTWTLPLASAVNAGQTVSIIDAASGIVTGTNTLTIARAGSDTVRGLSNWQLRNPRDGVCLVSDGVSKWEILGGTVSRFVAVTDLQIARWSVLSGVPSLIGTTLLPASAGGTALDASASTGIAKVAAGTWSVSAVDLATANVTGVLPIANGGTGQAVGAIAILQFTGAAVAAGSTVFLGTAGANATEANVALPCRSPAQSLARRE